MWVAGLRYGFWSEFMDYEKNQVELIGVEAGGPDKSKKHAAPLTYGSKLGVLHGAMQYVNQDKMGQIEETESISAGLDYPGVSPFIVFLKTQKEQDIPRRAMKKHSRLISLLLNMKT